MTVPRREERSRYFSNNKLKKRLELLIHYKTVQCSYYHPAKQNLTGKHRSLLLARRYIRCMRGQCQPISPAHRIKLCLIYYPASSLDKVFPSQQRWSQWMKLKDCKDSRVERNNPEKPHREPRSLGGLPGGLHSNLEGTCACSPSHRYCFSA
ncbi:hypothetical protein Y1Q_0000729 [Alligator mississippiensis]|uniref:Uncharacterized protein n=1 Tax=Alligator mississippiensis TaxID=8496 RepID=A0A151MC69_ALLMI|nr:hypothetical protein Y1Q_0000729 [Alligator mississippiensis]